MSKFFNSRRPDNQDSQSLHTGLEAAEKTGAFPELAEPDLIALFNAGHLVKFAPGELAFSADQLANQIVIVLSGVLKLHPTESNGEHAETIEPGHWICDGDFDSPPTGYRLAATAATRGSALAIDRASFQSLNDKLQAYLMRRVTRVDQERLQQQKEINHRLAQSQTKLLDALYQWRAERGSGFAQSPLVQQLFTKVPKLPVSSINLLSRILDDRTTKNEIVEMVSLDQSLTSNLLRAVNSALYGFEGKIRDVHHAIVLLGHIEVYQIVISESTRYSLPETPEFAKLHQRSVEISRIAFAMAQLQQQVKPAEVSTIGILSEIGAVLIELLKSYNPQLTDLFGYVDRAEMGAELLRSWKLPDPLCDALRYQDFPEFAPPARIPEDVRASVAVLYLSRRLHQRLYKAPSTEPGAFVHEYLKLLGLNGVDETTLMIERVLPRLRAQLASLPRSLAEAISSAKN